jgi:hypothetical protein
MGPAPVSARGATLFREKEFLLPDDTGGPLGHGHDP